MATVDTAPGVPRRLTPSRLSLARRLRGLSQTALANDIGLSPAAISQFESGTAQPSPQTLERLALRLKVTPLFLTRDEVRETGRPFFRSLSRVPASERDRAHAYALALADVVAEVEQVLELPELEIKPLLRAQPETSMDVVEATAERARATWRVPAGPIANVIAMAEARGVVVAAVGDFHEGIDAFTVTDTPRPIVVLCSEKGVATRRRFDLAHEIAHIVLHDQRADAPRWQEIQAHRFASALLMPAAEIREHLPRRGDDLRALERAAHDWGVSMQAALMRARDLGTVDESEFVRGMRRMSAAGWRTREPVEVGPPEAPRLLQTAVASLPQADSSLVSIAEHLGLPLGRLSRMVSLPESHDDARRGEVVPLR
jgi:Zn-dependent peptidase ImmA (M78 family)/transcriptional regulator with XRE-family HTH domain